MAVFFAVAVAATANSAVQLQRGKPDGYKTVAHAQWIGSSGKLEEGRAFIAELRARPLEGRTVEEIQAVDMAEFAFLRSSIKTEKKRCIECLKSVYDTNCTSFWGWAAYTFLKDLGEEIAEPPKDPLRGLGELGDGVVNLEPKRLEPDAGSRASNVDLAKIVRQPTVDGRKLKPEDLKPGSPARRAILRKRLVEICTEAKIKEILAAKGGRELFARLWDDDAVLEDFLLSGPVFNAPLALETLMTLFLNDEKEGWSKTEMGRRATVAVAINAQKGDDMTATVRHWAAFRRLGMLDRFVKGAKERDCRQWRYIVRRPVDPADILWLNTARSYPARLKRNVGLQGVPYRKRNCFNVSKWAKNDEYLRPWLASGWPRQYLRSRVGGVCTEQARWAALFSNAHGVMSQRAGQPRHCAWLLNESGNNWGIVNGIRPYTQGVFKLWGYGFQYIQSVERAFADRTAHDESELLLFAGRLREAAMRCPYNYTAWRAYTDSLKEKGAGIDEWRKYLGELFATQPDGRLVSWDFAWVAIEAMAAKGMDEKSLAKETARVFKNLPQPKTRIAEEMNYRRDALGRFLKRFAKNDELVMKILSVALDANRDGSNYLAQIFAYALGRWSKDKEKFGRFLAIASDYAGSGGETAKGDFNWRMISAIKGFREDRALFRMIADFRNESEPPTGAAKVSERDYGAPLVSGDALVRISSSGTGDTPEDYARVSDATPYDPKRKGLFATKPEDAPWAVVELAGDVDVTGVTVVGEAKDLVLWLSEDGEEWRKVGDAATVAGDLRVDLRKDSPTANFVKVGFEPGGGKKPLSLSKILVYGNRHF
ncbi:MAG: hypothetical protein IJG18_01250 [Kiritimatiellae bacterium]|nr:hypothetical protein [Kiritimatiellia bacterium]